MRPIVSGLTLAFISVGPVGGMALGQRQGSMQNMHSGAVGLEAGWISRSRQAPAIDPALPVLSELIGRSEPARLNVAGHLPVAGVKASLALRGDSNDHQRLLRELVAWSDAAVRGSRRSEPGRDAIASVSALPRSGVSVIEVIYPPRQLSRTRRQGRLVLDYWISPDRATALGLYWLRSGGVWNLGDGSTEAVARAVATAADIGEVGHDARFSRPVRGECVGESAYWLDAVMTYQLPVRPKAEADEELMANRYSFLRDNIVVEISMPEFVLEPNLGASVWMGIGPESTRSEFLPIARAIDQAIQEFARRPRS